MERPLVFSTAASSKSSILSGPEQSWAQPPTRSVFFKSPLIFTLADPAGISIHMPEFFGRLPWAQQIDSGTIVWGFVNISLFDQQRDLLTKFNRKLETI